LRCRRRLPPRSAHDDGWSDGHDPDRFIFIAYQEHVMSLKDPNVVNRQRRKRVANRHLQSCGIHDDWLTCRVLVERTETAELVVRALGE
jgi:hypothetical protein